jgi:hypothetical protein
VCLPLLLVQPASAVVDSIGTALLETKVLSDDANGPVLDQEPNETPRSVTATAPVPLTGEPELMERLISARREGDEQTTALLQSQLDALYGIDANDAEAEVDATNEVVLTAPDLGPGLNWVDGDIRTDASTVGKAKPSIASTPNGDLWVAMEHLDDNGISIHKSTDNGLSWIPIVAMFAGSDGRNPSVTYAANSTGKWIYVAFESVVGDGTSAIYVYRWGLDGSASGFVGIQSGITMAGPDDQIYPRITSDNLEFPTNPYLYLTYALYGIDYYPVYFRRSTDMGLTWSSAVNVTGGVENSLWSTRPDIAYGAAGLFITFEKLGYSGSTWNNEIFVTKGDFFGSYWSTPTNLTNLVDAQYHPRIAAAHGNASVLVAYTRDNFNTGDLDVNYYFSGDGGATWSGRYVLAASGEDEESVALAANNQQGNFHAAYWRNYDIYYSTAPVATPTDWSSPKALVNQSHSASLTYSRPAVATNPIALPYISAAMAWTDFRDSAYHVYFDATSLGASKVGIWRPGTGRFYLDVNGSGTWDAGIDAITVPFGVAIDLPVTGDWNGDGQSDAGVWRPSTGRFYLDANGNGTWDPGVDVITVPFGVPTDLPVTGDWDSDGDTDVGVWRPSTGRFYLDANGNNIWDPGVDIVTVAFGVPTDKPVTGDWNGDGQTDVGVWRPSTGSFYLDANGNHIWDPGVDVVTVAFGVPTDKPVTGDWNGDGPTDVGVWRPSTGSFYLDVNGNDTWDAGVDVVTVSFGVPSDVPVTGAW